MLTVLSLGAGVQSSTIALMAAHGEITPMPDCAIFADTQSEPKAVYEYLAWLETQLPFPVHRVTAGSLRQEILRAARGEQRMDARPPFFTSTGLFNKRGKEKAGKLKRQCTQDYKLEPIRLKLREMIGLKFRQRGPKGVRVIQWIGISIDEASRMKPSRHAWIEHRWPLIEMELSRHDCQQWLQRHGYPIPSKSACTFCPFHDNATWAALQRDDAVGFAGAVEVDRAIRGGVKDRRNGKPLSKAEWFVHRSLRPLEEVELVPETNQINLFENECNGLCGT